MEIYLDNNSSTPIDERVLAIMENVYLHSYGNADSRTHIVVFQMVQHVHQKAIPQVMCLKLWEYQ